MKPLKYTKADGVAYLAVFAYLAIMIAIKICFI